MRDTAGSGRSSGSSISPSGIPRRTEVSTSGAVSSSESDHSSSSRAGITTVHKNREASVSIGLRIRRVEKGEEVQISMNGI
jgi:hypothetical protein